MLLLAPYGRSAAIRYSSARDDKKVLICFLIELPIFFNKFEEKPTVIEYDDAAFSQKFRGIINFLYEASDYNYSKKKKKKKKNHFEKRFINISNKLWDLGICPSDF